MSDKGSRRELRPRQRPGIHVEHHGKQALISDAAQTKVLSLNESACAVWELCDGNTTIDEMVMAICQVTSVRPDQARDDVEMTISTLEGAGFLAFNPKVPRKTGPRPQVRNAGSGL